MAEADEKDRQTDGRPESATREALAQSLSARYRAPLMAYFNRRTGDFDAAEDLAQEVLVRALQRRELDGVESPDAYVFKIARNLLHDRVRRADVRQKHQVELKLRGEGAEELSAERVFQGREELEKAMNALAELKEKTRDIFILSRLEGMKYREIADLYGMSVSAVEKHLIQAFAHMMDRFDD